MATVSVEKDGEFFLVKVAVSKEEAGGDGMTLTRVLNQAQSAIIWSMHKSAQAKHADEKIAELQAAKTEALELPK
jgi:hypothetical protein